MNKKGAFGIDQTGNVVWILVIGLLALSAIVFLIMTGIRKGWFKFEGILP